VESLLKKTKVAITWYVVNAAMNFVGFVLVNGRNIMERLVVIINAINMKNLKAIRRLRN
jgi:hypothetical protein